MASLKDFLLLVDVFRRGDVLLGGRPKHGPVLEPWLPS
ncbi:unnamed protein product [Strongylus vulgaris]|uniref:Uncharacterized protein n=1 Tax=Strongylus vulgaris TaxID=40348 RepID=A0A3P7LJ49_STRVU|nr:unnamed protein product [Strongylus vulgaris]